MFRVGVCGSLQYEPKSQARVNFNYVKTGSKHVVFPRLKY